MWVSTNDLTHETVLYVGKVKVAALLRDLGVQHHLQQHVAELLGEVGGRSWSLCLTRRLERRDGVVQLPGLFDEMLCQRGVGLLAIPGAAIGCTETGAEPGHRPRCGEGIERREPANVDGLALTCATTGTCSNGAGATTRQQRYCSISAVEAGEQFPASAEPTRQVRLVWCGVNEHDQWSCRIDCGGAALAQRNNGDAVGRIQARIRTLCGSDECVDRSVEPFRGHGVGEAPASCTTAPSIATRAAER